jgi:hypothetical protein
MADGRSPNFQLTMSHDDLPDETFVRPIRLEYLPVHIVERFQRELAYMDHSTTAICYTSKGFRIIPRWKLRET